MACSWDTLTQVCEQRIDYIKQIVNHIVTFNFKTNYKNENKKNIKEITRNQNFIQTTINRKWRILCHFNQQVVNN